MRVIFSCVSKLWLCSVIAWGLLVNVAYAIDIKPDAPTKYTVKKGDTLWDISNMFLDQPWLWPQLWRNNTQLANPHLIYPGDVIILRIIDGEPVLEIQREKLAKVLAPTQVKTQKRRPVDVLPWDVFAPFISQQRVMSEEAFDALPKLLGNYGGDIMFTPDQMVVTREQNPPLDQFLVVRKTHTITSIDGDELGIQVQHIASASLTEKPVDGAQLVRIKGVNQEARQGDRLLYDAQASDPTEVVLAPATDVIGYVVDSLHDRQLLGKHDVVVVDMGNDQLKVGTVMGIYDHGPDILDDHPPEYDDQGKVIQWAAGDRLVVQPSIKIGELIIIRTFSTTSYGIITRARELVSRGAVVGHP